VLTLCSVSQVTLICQCQYGYDRYVKSTYIHYMTRPGPETRTKRDAVTGFLQRLVCSRLVWLIAVRLSAGSRLMQCPQPSAVRGTTNHSQQTETGPRLLGEKLDIFRHPGCHVPAHASRCAHASRQRLVATATPPTQQPASLIKRCYSYNGTFKAGAAAALSGSRFERFSNKGSWPARCGELSCREWHAAPAPRAKPTC
jgi:hypothetical protein